MSEKPKASEKSAAQPLSMWERELAAAIEGLGGPFWASLSDASVDPRGARSGLGAVALTDDGQWAGESQARGKEPTRDTRLAEIWGIELGARLAIEKGAKNAFLALCDCQPAVEALRWARQALDGGPQGAEPSGPAKEAALSAARALSEIGPWAVCWVPREKLSRSNDLARQALGLRPENKTAAGWSDASWRPKPPADSAALGASEAFAPQKKALADKAASEKTAPIAPRRRLSAR